MFVFARANHQQEQTPSYLPSYTRLGHAIPGSKTVSVRGTGRYRVQVGTEYLHALKYMIMLPVGEARAH